MNIIEKQGAVTRLATAIQNRMLKETGEQKHVENHSAFTCFCCGKLLLSPVFAIFAVVIGEGY